MDKRPLVIIVDRDDELRASLARGLGRLDQPVLARQGVDTCGRDGTSKIFLEFPSDLALLELTTGYVVERIKRAWSMAPESCASLAIALGEALINAIKHGNRSDPSKLIRFTVELSSDEAKFTVEDEGGGFAVNNVPHPRDRENLFRSSGRGVLLIKSIMDDTQYSDRGNRLIMIKRRVSLLTVK